MVVIYGQSKIGDNKQCQQNFSSLAIDYFYLIKDVNMHDFYKNKKVIKMFIISIAFKSQFVSALNLLC